MEFDQLEQEYRGKWIRGPHLGKQGAVIAYRAGSLFTTGHDGEQGYDNPADFVTDAGQEGKSLLEDLLPYPDFDTFFNGAIREAIAAAHFHAVTGEWYGDLNFTEGGKHCWVDNQQGEYGFVKFVDRDCVGVVSSGDPTRQYDWEEGILTAPPALQTGLREIAGTLEHWCHAPPTGLFWSDDGRLAGPEPFHVLYCYGFETMGSLILRDAHWIDAFEENFAGDTETASTIARVARKYCYNRRAAELSLHDWTRIFPVDAPARDDAMQAVTAADWVPIVVAPHC